MKILIVEDEKDLNAILTKHLTKNHFIVDSVFHGEEALDYLKYENYDLILLDVMMPKLNGYELTKYLRKQKNNTPILMLTAKDDIESKVKGLDLGADDYLVKPFDFNELLARIRAITRRKNGNLSNVLTVEDLILDLSRKKVTRAQVEIDLTGKEYEVLSFLLQNKGHIVSKEKIRDQVWNFDYEGESNIVEVIIKNIRKKIDFPQAKPLILTKRGLGYVIKESDKSSAE